MGMFDWVKCEYPLPRKLEGVSLFQTKSFNNLMETYRIGSDGYLYHTPIHYEFVEEEDRPYFGTKEWEINPLTRIFGSIKDIESPEERLYYSGRINFYWYDASNRISHDYTAIFLDAKIVDISYIIRNFLR
jgi:hypothetical protein